MHLFFSTPIWAAKIEGFDRVNEEMLAYMDQASESDSEAETTTELIDNGLDSMMPPVMPNNTEMDFESSPDLLATPFGAYDAAIIQAIQQRWFGLLEGLPSVRNASGKVTVKFQLMSNGKIMEMSVEEDTVGVIQSLLCQRAISDPAPYGKWPSDMRRLVGADYRQIRFSFYYN